MSIKAKIEALHLRRRRTDQPGPHGDPAEKPIFGAQGPGRKRNLKRPPIFPPIPRRSPARTRSPKGPQAAGEDSPQIESAEPADTPAEPVTALPDAPAVRKAAEKKKRSNYANRLKPILDEVIAACAGEDRGIEIRKVAGGYRNVDQVRSITMWCVPSPRALSRRFGCRCRRWKHWR